MRIYLPQPPQRGQGELLNTDGVPVCEGDVMFEKGIYFYIINCLCFVDEISEDMLEEQVKEETYPDLEGGEDFMVSGGR